LPGKEVLLMLRIVDPFVKFMYTALLSAGALAALVFAPPAGIVMLLFLRRHLHREANSHKRPKLHIELS
jgi:hypothetical protein